MILGAGWKLTHVTDRVVELQKDDVAYRRFLGRDGYVRVRAEPGMDRQALINKAVEVAKENDEALALRVTKHLMPRNARHYQMRQAQLATAFGTPEDPEIIGRKSA